MKKLIALAIGSIVLAGVAPAQANPQGAIAVIDVNFESQIIDGPVTEVCLAGAAVCNSNPALRKAGDYKIFNHGTIMADIIRANNPSAPLFLLEAGTSKTGVITGIQLGAALNWVVANAAANNIVAVSFSYNAGNGDKCTPSSPGVKVGVTHENIVNAVAKLKAAGVKVYAASGNHGSGNKIDYPACIADVVAVGSTTYRGSIAKSDVVLAGNTYTSPKLKSPRTALQGLHDSYPVTLTDKHPLMAGWTTSVTTAIAAATNK